MRELIRRIRVMYKGECSEEGCNQPCDWFYYRRCHEHGYQQVQREIQAHEDDEREEKIAIMQEAYERAQRNDT
jgi:hypothetical protein